MFSRLLSAELHPPSQARLGDKFISGIAIVLAGEFENTCLYWI
jgi:hypothetical protein